MYRVCIWQFFSYYKYYSKDKEDKALLKQRTINRYATINSSQLEKQIALVSAC